VLYKIKGRKVFFRQGEIWGRRHNFVWCANHKQGGWKSNTGVGYKNKDKQEKEEAAYI